jgi:hypothetical protein
LNRRATHHVNLSLVADNIHPRAQTKGRRGIGRKLVNCMVAHAHQIGIPTIDLTAHDSAVVALYAGDGFKFTCAQLLYLGDRSDKRLRGEQIQRVAGSAKSSD